MHRYYSSFKVLQSNALSNFRTITHSLLQRIVYVTGGLCGNWRKGSWDFLKKGFDHASSTSGFRCNLYLLLPKPCKPPEPYLNLWWFLEEGEVFAIIVPRLQFLINIYWPLHFLLKHEFRGLTHTLNVNYPEVTVDGCTITFSGSRRIARLFTWIKSLLEIHMRRPYNLKANMKWLSISPNDSR